MNQEIADYLRQTCLEMSNKANNFPTSSQEFNALIDAAAAIQDVLENNDEWHPSPQTASPEATMR